MLKHARKANGRGVSLWKAELLKTTRPRLVELESEMQSLLASPVPGIDPPQPYRAFIADVDRLLTKTGEMVAQGANSERVEDLKHYAAQLLNCDKGALIRRTIQKIDNLNKDDLEPQGRPSAILEEAKWCEGGAARIKSDLRCTPRQGGPRCR